MATCSRCGNPVEFRHVDGRCIPYHFDGNCLGTVSSNATDFSGYNISRESTCFSTHCPKCSCEVFFIKHNGGSVWIDPPLGPPWYKHTCFDITQDSNGTKSLLEDYRLSIGNRQNEKESNLIIGIVKSTRVDVYKRFTDIHFETGKNEIRNIRLQHNAGFLLGKLCVYDEINSEVFPLDETQYIFAIYKAPSLNVDFVKCPKCGISVNLGEIENHLRLKHNYKVKCPICNIKVNPKSLYQHLKSKHVYKASTSNTDLISCPECGVQLNPKNFYKHLVRQHGIK